MIVRAFLIFLFLLSDLFGGPMLFEDVTTGSGLSVPLSGMMGHAAAWGDYNNDGKPDLFVGGFCDRPDAEYAPAKAPVPTRLFRNSGNGRFQMVNFRGLKFCGRTSGAIFADFNQDGYADLYVSNNRKAKVAHPGGGVSSTAQQMSSKLFANQKDNFKDVSAASGACPDSLLTARGIGVFDYNGDGRLDLFIVEDKFAKGKLHARSILLRNRGGFKFQIANSESGIPDDVYGLGIAVADINDDGKPDFLVTHSNRVFLSSGGNRFIEAKETEKNLAWTPADSEDWPSGAAFADLNGDARLDLVVANHHAPARNRVYLNRGMKNGEPVFQDVTAAAGLDMNIPTKSPHVEVQDFDNDGLPDIFFSAAWKEKDGITPLIFRNIGVDKNGMPHFRPIRPIQPGMIYYPAGPTADFNNDGKLDIFLVSWVPAETSRLLANRTSGGNWLNVRAPIGTRIELSSSGKRVAAQQIYPGFGFSSGQMPVAHFGLGHLSRVNVTLVLPKGAHRVKKSVAANQTLVFGD